MLDFLLSDIFLLEADILLVPVSTAGTTSSGFETGLQKLGVKLDHKSRFQLGDIKVLSNYKSDRYKQVVLVCSVGENYSTYSAIRKIGQEVGRLINSDLRSVVSPIIGSGAGGLSHTDALNIMRTAFYETAPDTANLTFCTMDSHVREMFESVLLDIDRPSAQLVIDAEIDKIRGFDHIREIINYHDFYYQLARDKWSEFLAYENDQAFFRQLLDTFKRKKIPYQQFLRSLEAGSPGFNFVQLCGELIAYIDYNAYNKSKWNRYQDKRVIARSGVNQSLWLKNLIKVKLRGIEGLDGQSVKNALYFLDHPQDQLSMLSVQHRQKVFKNMLLRPYEDTSGLTPIFDFFQQLGFHTVNPENNTALIGRLLYLPEIKRLWNGENSEKENDELISVAKENELFLAKSLIEECLEEDLKSLDLGNCGINDLNDLPELFDCIQLEELTLSNQWAEYKSGRWVECYSENSGKPNLLSHIPNAISKLKSLKKFRCGGNWWTKDQSTRWSIADIKFLNELPNLQYLNLSNNAVSNLTPIRRLKNLVELHLNNNKIVDLKPLLSLHELRYVYISNNNIEDLTALKNIDWLDTLDLHSNKIHDLSPLVKLIDNIGVKNSSWAKGTINIASNPLTLPSMPIVNISTEAVLQTIRDIKEGHYINTDIKIVLIGNSETGKSTLTKYLNKEKDLEKPHAATLWLDECIVQSKYKIDKIGDHCDLHIFDFGGHDFYHDTHHIFYSINTLYVLLWQKELEQFNIRQLKQKDKKGNLRESPTQDYPITYWLDSVRYYTKIKSSENLSFKTAKEETYSSPLLVVQTNVKNANEIKPQNQEKLKEDYPFIQDFLNVSIRNPQRHMGHFDMVFLEALNSMGIIGEKLPMFYGPIREAIERYKGKPVLNQREFIEFCNALPQVDISEEQASIALSYFEQIGVLLCSGHSISQKIYIDKEWVIVQMQILLDGLIEDQGKFTIKDALQKIDRNETVLNDIIILMLEFKIIFKHPLKSDTYLAPLYLPAMPSDKISLFLNPSIKPFRRFEYTGYIQKNLILSVFQKYGAQLKQGDSTHHYYWKDALILKAPQQEEIVLIKFFLGDDHGNSRIDIYNLKSETDPTFIHEIIGTIRALSEEYDFDEMVSNDGIDFVSLKVLEENAKLGKWIFSERKLTGYKIPATPLKLLMLKDFTRYTTPVKKKKVVISYSKKDLAQIHTFIRYLKPLVADNLIEEPWYCSNLLPGDDWDEKIGDKFKDADIIFFMISEYLLATKYVQDHEIKNAIDRFNNGDKVKIVPIVLEFYDWRRSGTYNLQKFSALPYQLKPISDYSNPKIAWSTITTSVRDMIEKDLDPGREEIVSREVQELLERQVNGKLDRNN